MSVLDTSILTAKLEASYGTWAAPTAAADAMVVFDHQLIPMESEEVRRQVEKGFRGGNSSAYTAIRQRQTFSTELAGSGTVDAPAFWAVLLRGCMFDAPVPAPATHVVYPIRTAVDDGASISVGAFKGGVLSSPMRGARGNATLVFEEKQIPRIDWDFVGLLQESNIIAAGSPGTIALPDPPVGQEVSLTNTVIQLGGTTLGVRRLSIDLGNKLEYFSTTGQRQVLFGKDEGGDGRQVTAEAVFELPNPATKNFFADILPRTALAFSLVHGLTAGNIVEITSSRAILGRADFSVESGRLFMNCPIEFIPTSAGNELTWRTR
ncbi:MAG: phage tail tube protein [Sphingomonadaceae bacterium]